MAAAVTLLHDRIREAFRANFYAGFLREIIADPRETVPVALALFLQAGGNPARRIMMGANFGRDADTIATMAGGLAGAFRGAWALPASWVAKAGAGAGARYAEIADRLAAMVRRRRDEARAQALLLDTLIEEDAAGAG